MKFVKLLLDHKITPVLVFDGDSLPMKRNRELERKKYVIFSLFFSLSRIFSSTSSNLFLPASVVGAVCATLYRKREEYKTKALEYLRMGNQKAANDFFQRAVDITPRMAYNLIQVLQQEGIEYIVAPYEADAQLAYLSLHHYIDAVITEDSDLIPYGASRVLLHLTFTVTIIFFPLIQNTNTFFFCC
jgi:exonuclease-1